jgi:hypothetical protein
MPIDRLWQLYQSISEWIRFADTKAGAAVAAHAAVFVAAAPALTAQAAFLRQNTWLLYIVLGCTALAASSLFFALRCLIPRLSVGEPKSIIFFGHIAKAYDSASAFAQHAFPHYADDDGYTQQLLDQIHTNSKIAWRKHCDSARCLWCLVFEFSLASLGFVIGLFVL